MIEKLLKTLQDLRELADSVSEGRPEEDALLADADAAIAFVRSGGLSGAAPTAAATTKPAHNSDETIAGWIGRLGENMLRTSLQAELSNIQGSHLRIMRDLANEAIDYARWLSTTPNPPRLASAASRAAALSLPADLHPDTAALVVRFANAMAEKLMGAQSKRGFTNEWAQNDWMDQCRQDLVKHVAKGDPRDVAAYSAFLWHHGERTELPSKARPDLELVITTDQLGECCVVAWQDDEHRIVDVVWERDAGAAHPALANSRKDARVMAVGDMGEGRQLVLFREDDGDIIVCVTPIGHKFSEEDVQFCTGVGGGKSPATHAALQRLWHAMHLDQERAQVRAGAEVG